MKIVVGGQFDKNEIANDILKISNNSIQVDIKNDLDAAMAVKNGEYDYYIGACNTGGGGALAMAIALVGADYCSTLSMPGNIKDDDFIKKEVREGKKAFGFTAQHRENILPTLIKEIMDYKGGN
ncbi:MAG: DUF2620 domain-containing protein [Miniphocaeibacter sp.]|uniref:DUF2620 domain-containing protein n=1 Tax=Miniphocaeibacter sp. TaxID=3100973 RepID=UPI0017903934|nr:DUF2620 domain-containing protein [Gallicola sp.]